MSIMTEADSCPHCRGGRWIDKRSSGLGGRAADAQYEGGVMAQITTVVSSVGFE
jgi:hypothetical protein